MIRQKQLTLLNNIQNSIHTAFTRVFCQWVSITRLGQIRCFTDMPKYSIDSENVTKHSSKQSERLYDLYGPFSNAELPKPEAFSKLPPNVQAAYLEPLRRPARYGIITCSLQMRSFEVHRLAFFADFSMRAAYYIGLCASGPVPLPKRIERWTVPRGPFVHSKSKENFERITYKRLITIKDGHPRVVDTWLAYLAKHVMSGIGMKAHVFRYEAIMQEKERDSKMPEEKH
ncbi:ribosomal protein S10 [Pneumocystis jirovecii RU7]|uniref:Small ribosomal subunit protein uS10m n=1 Tax=Pneumocystis jirovecii (strain RU7) TaxID=1408657 RepID=A0A0W4ZFM4_PNEJ7|nr:ribosomal protein S10 [Pneumocystis jirovecii RU7]KTW27175.1 ribosomal protein S10 [Pneumocystis jirovecii RU7]